ncbi:EthD domain-containing protein [Chloroflexota bacterium]
MVKGIALLKRKPGLTVEEFRKHYEEVHAPLAVKLFPTIRKYMRNYITSVPFPADAGELEFDCITEQWFDDMEGFQAMMDAGAGEAGRTISNDEKTFLDRAKTVYLLVEEVATK